MLKKDQALESEIKLISRNKAPMFQDRGPIELIPSFNNTKKAILLALGEKLFYLTFIYFAFIIKK